MATTNTAAANNNNNSNPPLDQKFADQAEVDLMAALGISDTVEAPSQRKHNANNDDDDDGDLAGLAEILPEVTGVRKPPKGGGGVSTTPDDGAGQPYPPPPPQASHNTKNNDDEDEVNSAAADKDADISKDLRSSTVRAVHNVEDQSSSRGGVVDTTAHSKQQAINAVGTPATGGTGAGAAAADLADFDYPDSENALEGEDPFHEGYDDDPSKIPKEFVNVNNHNLPSSAQSISTATRQTHDVKMPMYLPNFKPATGCTNASDFIVRCFVARLRSGITVVKHGRSRWCKSRLRILQIHPDGRSLSWKPAEGEPTSNKKPPRLDLTTCLEVRHAWSPDPQNPMYTGTPILRQKCEAANAHKSFALIFKNRTVDITAVTADQCKVLMEGFSALCFRLQVANIAGGSGNNGRDRAAHRPMPEEDGVSTTASATLTNNSTTPRTTTR